jgi:hypothetical protein
LLIYFEKQSTFKMNNITTSIALRIWIFSALTFSAGCFLYLITESSVPSIFLFLLVAVIVLMATVPAFVVLYFVLPSIKNSLLQLQEKISRLIIVCGAINILYAMLIGEFLGTEIFSIKTNSQITTTIIVTILLLACNLIALYLVKQEFLSYFSNTSIANINDSWQKDSYTQINNYMQTNPSTAYAVTSVNSSANNSILIKLIIVVVLTLLMLIPTTFISSLIIERQTTYAQQQKLKPTQDFTEQLSAKNYEKSMRTTKYAILVIGLTFAVFFLIELLHKRPVHPVQYTLVGLALAIFYILVLSIGEYILFDYAYIISSIATISLISLYVKSHFKNWNASLALGGVLTALYAFILVLISLENTALIIGSISLFVVLAVVMYTTRNVDWYNINATKETSIN